jgi:tRNA (guanine-N7-)-methyltransferase
MTAETRLFQSEKVLKPKKLDQFKLPKTLTANTLDIEIGCGVGWHPIQYAKNNPDRFLVAIEHTREKFTKFKKRIENNEALANLLPVHANAIAWITHSLKPQSVSKILILYPNPERKAVNKRWIRMPFMAKLIEILKPDGEIVFATNEKFYRDEIVEFAPALGLKVTQERKLTRKNQPRTHFEKKYIARGETCFDLKLALKIDENLLAEN